MTNDTLLYAAAQLKKYCKETPCENCIFGDRNYDHEFIKCRIDAPEDWNIDDITGGS